MKATAKELPESSELWAEFDVEEAVTEMRAELRERDGFEQVRLRMSRRQNDKHRIRVFGATEEQRPVIKAIAREWQGLAWHPGMQGFYANFVVEFVEPQEETDSEAL